MSYAKLIERIEKNKLIYMACILGSFLSVPLPAYAASNHLTVYAGPQSVAPKETIYVSVEVMQEALAGTNVSLSYMQEGVRQTVIGKTRFGLASFEIPAQEDTGEMRFKAEAEGAQSEDALVSVIAGKPKAFDLLIKRSADNAVDIYSNIITDEFNNNVSALSLVTVEWIDAQGLKSRQNTHLSRGAIELTASCPKDYLPPLRIRASLNSASYTSRDLSPFCALDTE